MGTSSITGLETILFVDNASFDGTERAGAMSQDGELWIGSTSGRHVRKNRLTAGTGITITNGAGSITIAASQTAFNYTNVTFAMSPYTVVQADYYISVDSSGGAVTLRFPNVPDTNRIWVIKDRTGNASTNNITITTVGGAINFDGATSYKIISNYGAINLLANGTTTYEVY